jgi:hypothetical protein
MIKKSPFVTVPVEPLEKAVAAAKFAELSVVPDANLAILEIVAPPSVLVNVVTALPAANAALREIEPGLSKPIVALAVPRVAL